MVVRPLRLSDTTEKAGFDHIDSISMWFLGGSGTSGAEATGINDDDRYGLDLLNIGSGGLSLRATSGNGLHQIRVDNTAAAIVGGLSVTGTATFASPVIMQSTLNVTGVATFTNVTVLGTLGVTGAATLQSTLNVTGVATFSTGVNVGGTLNVTGVANFVTNVTIQQGLTVSQSSNLIGNLAVGGSLTVTGVGTFITNVTMNQGLVVSQSATVGGNLGVTGALTVTGVATFVTNVAMSQGLNVSQSVVIDGNLTMTGASSTLSVHDVVITDDLDLAGSLILGSYSESGITTGTSSNGHIVITLSGLGDKRIAWYNP